MLGSVSTGSLVLAGNFYDSKGNVKAPAGSHAQFDYFRERQQQLNVSTMRGQADEERLDR